MKTVKEITENITSKTGYPKDVVHYQVERIIEKFNYEVTKSGLLDGQDAEDIEFIVDRFLSEHHRQEKEDKPITNLMPMVKRLTTDTKPLPRIQALKLFHRR